MRPTIIPYNEKSFTPEEVDAGMVTEFIDFLLKQDKKSAELINKNHKYTNINIASDGYCTIVQYCEVYFDINDPCFEFVDEGEHVATVLTYPDNSAILCWDKEEAKEKLDEWLKEHPTWKQNEYGRWYDEEEVQSIRDFEKYSTEDILKSADPEKVDCLQKTGRCWGKCEKCTWNKKVSGIKFIDEKGD